MEETVEAAGPTVTVTPAVRDSCRVPENDQDLGQRYGNDKSCEQLKTRNRGP